MNPYAGVLLAACIFMVLLGTFSRGERLEPGRGWFLVLGLLGLVGCLRIFEIVSYFQLWMVYGANVTTTYVLTFYAAYFKYKDPASESNQQRAQALLSKKRWKVAYIVPVYKEPVFIVRCVNSIITAAKYAETHGIDVEIVVVDDASPDNTWEVLQQFANNPRVRLVSASKNVRKKGALTIGMCGGERWREGYSLFAEKYGHKPRAADKNALLKCLHEVDCDPPHVDFYEHTDSDSIVGERFIYLQVVAFVTNPRLGALSGHCDAWLDPDADVAFVTALQVAWYYTQFRIRKAAESWRHWVFCVSGPGAGFRAEAVLPVLPAWVDDQYGAGIYAGATDRMITFLILMQGWWIDYSAIASTHTVVPENWTEARSQWTRWKQNFWRMLGPVWKNAWKAPLPIAYMTYSRLIITVLAPFIMIDHVFAISLGNLSGTFVYISGLMIMGSIMGVAFTSHNPSMWKYGLLRPVMSVVSAFWGSTLTLRAFYLDRKRVFTWRDAAKKGGRPGRLLNRWFTPTFELRVFLLMAVGITILWILKVGLGVL